MKRIIASVVIALLAGCAVAEKKEEIIYRVAPTTVVSAPPVLSTQPTITVPPASSPSVVVIYPQRVCTVKGETSTCVDQPTSVPVTQPKVESDCGTGCKFAIGLGGFLGGIFFEKVILHGPVRGRVNYNHRY
ncbi:hypothetical protein HY415_02475 [Candidatus Kaiserbacteria bacterium]|nr:hypothetical protein [Candidatus Kaiserbacteria bacterium]